MLKNLKMNPDVVQEINSVLGRQPGALKTVETYAWEFLSVKDVTTDIEELVRKGLMDDVLRTLKTALGGQFKTCYEL